MRLKPATQTSFSMFSAGLLYSVGMLGGLFIQLILAAIIRNIFASDSEQYGYILSITYSVLAPAWYIAVVFLGGRLMGVHVPNAVGLAVSPRPRNALYAILLSCACVVCFLPLAVGFQKLFALLGYTATPSYADYTSSWSKMLLGVFALAIMPALGEETLLRGCAFSGMRTKGTYFGILMSALLFALLHGSPVQFIHQFLIGCVMAFLVYMTGTMWTSVLFHFFNNLIVIVYEFIYEQAGASYVIPWWGYLIMFVVGAPLVALLLVALTRNVKKEARAKMADELVVDGVVDGESLSQPATPTFLQKMRQALDYDGRFLPYNKQERMGVMWVAFLLTGLLWILNTVSGWMQP